MNATVRGEARLYILLARSWLQSAAREAIFQRKAGRLNFREPIKSTASELLRSLRASSVITIADVQEVARHDRAAAQVQS